MTIDIVNEKLISPTEYTKMRPSGRNGRPMSLATVYRHMFQGVKGIRLEHVKIGGNTYTSVEAVQRFVERLTSARAGTPTAPAGTSPPTPPPAPRTPSARARAITQADRELERLGI
jgi:hypothetical protein